ncbi:MAG: hypothetical protein PHP72_01690 [Dysgonamonadaceae bacterium]|nr:hypothetical protein [Dysgonamonadaceae bacterium]
MEIEELKNTWSTLDNQLKENKSLNERIIKEMIDKKANKSLSKLLFWDIFSIVGLFVLIPFIVYGFSLYGGQKMFWDITAISAAFFCIIGVVWYFIKIHGLMKVDINQSVGKNIYYINRYTIQIKREKIAITYFVGIPLTILIILTYIEEKVPLPFWVFMSCGLILGAFVTYWSYKRIYQKNIYSIQKSLDEIKELKEEEE